MEQGEIFELAEDGQGRLMAFCGRRPDGVEGLYAHPEAQGQGLGTFLLNRAESALFSAGATVLKVDSSLPALTFYERHGYGTVKRSIYRSRGGRAFEIVRMTKSRGA
jgi:GNAT superfamily N-acetyltransferase